jgi:hypothetical protein
MSYTKFMPIAIMEHHQLVEPRIDIYDISVRLEQLWAEIEIETGTKSFDTSARCIMALNRRIAESLGEETGAFRKETDWLVFVAECGGMDEDPGHVSSWILSQLYWNHLTKFKLATTWLLVNALRLQTGLPENRLTVEKLGLFLGSLSGSGPPVYDGQTFYPDSYY